MMPVTSTHRLRNFLGLFFAALLVATVSCGGEKSASDTPAAGAPAGGAPAGASATTAAAGEKMYQQRCMSCHQADGNGTPGVYPPLAGSEYATSANAGVPIRIAIYGLQGPIEVKGAQFNSLMPAYGLGIVMSDADVAAVLTYIRSSWGNKASAVTANDVHEVREETEGHTGAMSAELLKPLMRN